MPVAYLDPGSGSLIASALVGGAAAAGVAVKSARAKFSGAFSRKRKGRGDSGADATDDGRAEATEAADTGESTDPAETVDAGAEPAEASADSGAAEPATSET
ncbi:MAG TPA: hypothetical protein VIL48_07890 [Acidimicrobiales bacterium]